MTAGPPLPTHRAHNTRSFIHKFKRANARTMSRRNARSRGGKERDKGTGNEKKQQQQQQQERMHARDAFSPQVV